MSQKVKSVVIIGAGIGGLGTANLLAQAGYDVTVVEKNECAGGRAGLLKKDGFLFDSGPSWYLMPEVFEQYFAALGENLDNYIELERLAPAYKVFFEKHPPITIHADRKRDKETFENIEPGAGAALERYLQSAESTYNIATKQFLYTNFNTLKGLASRDLLRLAPAMVKGVIEPIDRHVSRYVKDLRLRQILEYTMVFLGTSPFEAPSMYSLMSHMDFNQGVFYPKGGMYTIIEAMTQLGKSRGVEYRFNEPVERIIYENKQAVGVLCRNGREYKAEVVISNADLHFTETTLLSSEVQSYPESFWKSRQPSPSALLMYLGIKGKLPELQHHNLFFAEDWKGNFDTIFKSKDWPHPASLYVCKPSQTDPSVAPKGHENVFVLVPIPAGKNFNSSDIENHANKYIEQIADMSGIKDLKNRIVSKTLFGPQDFMNKYNSWQGTALGLSHLFKQSAIFRPKNQSSKLKNLFYVGGNTVPGIGLPMCLIGSQLVYKRVVGDKSSGPLPPIKDSRHA
jgi:1-hydroxy-2-isopentenylcarotenoid 3,4-desaturase